MFGAALFQGEDISSSPSPTLDSTGGGNYGGLYPQGYQGAGQSVSQGINEDPAYQATQDAAANANLDTSQANQNMVNAQDISSGIGRATGLFSAIEGLVGPRQKRLRKSQRVYSRAQAQAGIDNANRALSQYQQDSAIEQRRLSQSYSGRGLGESSIKNEGMQYFQDTEARKMAALQQNVQLAQLGQRLNNSQISASYANTWTSFGNSIAAFL